MDVVETDEYPLIDDYLGSGVEFVEGSSGVKGRLKQCISYWESTICAPQFVLGQISEGYRLPFVRFPDKCHLRNNRSAVRHPQFVEEAISKLLLNDCIQEHCEPPYCVNPLSVAEGKKLRLVIDLSTSTLAFLSIRLGTTICIAFLKCLNRTFGFLRGISSRVTIT